MSIRHQELPRRLVGGLCTELRLHRIAPEGCLLKERSGTDPIMKTHHEADHIMGRCGTPTFEIKDSPLHAQLVLACYVPHLVLHSALILLETLYLTYEVIDVM